MMGHADIAGETWQSAELRRYLLGSLDDSRAEQLDAALFEDSAESDALLAALEDERRALVDDHVAGRLSREENARLLVQAARSYRLRVAIEDTRLLATALEARQRAAAVRSIWRGRVAGMALAALAAALCVAAGLYVHQRGHSRSAPAAPAAIASVPAAAQPATGLRYTAFLAAATLRGADAAGTSLHIPPGTSEVLLQAEIRSGSSGPLWQASLMRGGEQVWSTDMATLQKTGPERYVELRLPPEALTPGAYVLTLRGPGRELETRRFQVQR